MALRERPRPAGFSRPGPGAPTPRVSLGDGDRRVWGWIWVRLSVSGRFPAALKGSTGLSLHLLQRPSPGENDMEAMGCRSSRSNQSGSSLSPLREDEDGGGMRWDKGITCFNPQRLHKAGTPLVGCLLLPGPSPTSLRCFPHPSPTVGFGCSERGFNQGLNFVVIFLLLVLFFLQSHSGHTWSQGPRVTVGDDRC